MRVNKMKKGLCFLRAMMAPLDTLGGGTEADTASEDQLFDPKLIPSKADRVIQGLSDIGASAESSGVSRPRSCLSYLVADQAKHWENPTTIEKVEMFETEFNQLPPKADGVKLRLCIHHNLPFNGGELSGCGYFLRESYYDPGASKDADERHACGSKLKRLRPLLLPRRVILELMEKHESLKSTFLSESGDKAASLSDEERVELFTMLKAYLSAASQDEDSTNLTQ